MGDRKTYHRTNSICPPPPEVALLEAVKANDLETIKKLVKEKDLLNFKYDHPYNKSIFLIACQEDGISPETVQTLLNCSTENLLYQKDDDGNNAIHLAVQNTNSKILEVLLKNCEYGKINELVEYDNALHILIKYGDSDKEEEFEECAKLLIRNGINVNQSDGKNLSSILLAAKNNYKNLVKVILETSIAHVDLDSHKLRNNQTARQLIRDNNLYDKPLPEKSKLNEPKQILLGFIKESNEDEFINYVDQHKELINDATLLELSCEYGLAKVVDYLVKNGADFTKITKNPLELAAESGYYQVVKILLDRPEIRVSPQIICYLLKQNYAENFCTNINYEKCYNLIMEKVQSQRIDLNDKDENFNTPLHYAVRYADPEKINKLLKMGASLATKNQFDIMPVEDIEPVVLERHLNDCIKFDLKNKNLDKPDFEVIFDYTTLVPPKLQKSVEVESNLIENYMEETELIYYISKAPEMKFLLKHPVIVSFLLLKWYRIRRLFYFNLSLYCLFVFSLISYIFCYFGEIQEESSVCAWLSWIVLLITFILLILREFFQICIAPTSYFRNFENFIEIFLIVVTAIILFLQSPTSDTRRQLSSIAIVLAAFGLVLMLGQHPTFSINVAIFKLVSLNFFQLLSWYSLLIIAFALSFNILFAQNKSDEENLFMGPEKSIFKTIVMLTGEFDASAINFSTYPITSKLIFILFVFMITIILLNLLNGLAVNDTQTIKSEAELVTLATRTQHIRYVESMILGNILPETLIKTIRNFCCCLPGTTDYSYILFKSLAKNICLFPHLFNYEVVVLLNNRGQIQLQQIGKRKRNNRKIWNSYLYLDKDILKRTKSIIQDKRRNNRSFDLNNDKMLELLNQILQKLNKS